MTLVASSLSGCSVTRMSAMERHFHEAKSLEVDYPDETFSEAQQFMYSVERVAPTGVNNLDTFNAFESIKTNSFAANAAGASLAIPRSPWLALNHLILAERRNGTPLLRQNILILMDSIESNASTPSEQLSADVERTVDNLTIRAKNLIEDAYDKAGTPVKFVEPDTNRRSGYASWFSPTFYVPEGVDYCPQNISTVSELDNSQLKYCATILTNRGFVNFLNEKETNPLSFSILGNYAYKLVRLPDGFPVDKLKSPDTHSFVFMPTFIYRKSDILNNLSQSKILELFEDGRISLNPLLKNIHSGEYMYFSKDLTKFQKSKYQRINDKEVLETVNASK